MSAVDVVKANGDREPFDENKLRRSLEHAGASPDFITRIIDRVNERLRPGITTHTIYKMAFKMLSELEGGSAARYSLKRSVASLGPSGFPFEQFISRMYEVYGYKTETNVVLNGTCIDHEVDIIAENESSLHVIEAKFHNQYGLKSDMKAVLYVHARFQDLENNSFDGRLQEGKKHECVLITNTKFTLNSQKYSKCAGLKLIGWSYPKGNSLEQMITKVGLQPLTCLTSLSTRDKQILMKDGLVLCRSVREHPEALNSLGLHKDKKEAVLSEIAAVCGI